MIKQDQTPKRSRLVLSSFAVMLLASATTAVGCADDPTPTIPVGEVEQLHAPAPVAGGTMLVTADKQLAVMADPDIDKVLIVDLATMELTHTVDLEEGDEPGRVIAGPQGTAFVALRRGGAIASVDTATGDVQRTAACPAPRGMTYDAYNKQLHLACAGGELLTMAADAEGNLTGEVTRALQFGNDLRDVVQRGDNLLVSRFRSAELLTVARRRQPCLYAPA